MARSHPVYLETMQITLSFATTADGYLDDNSPRRLMISTPEDWEAVLRLRASHDAILAGAETLRRDDPALLLRDAAARELRRARGMRPDLTKVTLTHSGRLSPSMRFFTEGDADRYVFSEKELPELKGVAEVISSDSSITASAIVTELEKRGVERLLVEGGASVLRMFLAEGMADTVRRAVNPQLTLGPERGGAQFRFEVPEGAACRQENLGGMEVATCTLRPDTRDGCISHAAGRMARSHPVYLETMQITLSFATTADGYLDDNSPRRLMISTPEDWEAVLRLRASHDAILAGAETLRRDDPALLLRDAAARELRRARGMRPDLTKVTLTHSGRLSPSMRFFTEGDADRYVFSEKELPELKGVAEVISSDSSITASAIVTELEKRGVERLLVEGGASVLRMFLAEGMADTVRRAVNPQLTLGPERGGAQFRFEVPEGAACRQENLGGMEVATCTLRPDTRDEDLRYLAQAVAEGLRCVPSRTSYCVGAVVALPDGRSFTGYTHETSPTHHAEQEAIRKALDAGAELRGAAIYSSMEPCSQRKSEPESCTQLILRHGFARVVFALYEPDRFVRCRGAQTLREAGVDVRVYPELAEGVRRANAHLGR